MFDKKSAICPNSNTKHFQPNVSIIIPAYNNAQTIGLVLNALKSQSYSGQTEVLIIDDGSKDSTVEVCKLSGFEVNRNDRNCGLAYSLNKGISLSKYEIIITLHADTIPQSNDWLTLLTMPFLDLSVSGVCCIERNRSDDDLDLWEKLLLVRLGDETAFTDKSDAYRKSVFSEIGLFDEKTYRTAGEDEDFGLRLRLNNKKLVASNARVFHRHVYPNSKNYLNNILKKEYIFGQAGGALRRKFPTYKPGAYIYLTPKSAFYDGGFRAFICIASLIPYLQLFFLPLLVVVSFRGFSATREKIDDKRIYYLFPMFNFLRYWTYTVGYLKGILTGKQR